VEKIIYANGTAEVLVPAGQKIAIATYGNEYATLSFKRGNNLEFIQRLDNAQVTLGPWSDVRTVNIEAAQDQVSYDVGTAPFLESNVRMSSNPFTGGGDLIVEGSRFEVVPPKNGGADKGELLHRFSSTAGISAISGGVLSNSEVTFENSPCVKFTSPSAGTTAGLQVSGLSTRLRTNSLVILCYVPDWTAVSSIVPYLSQGATLTPNYAIFNNYSALNGSQNYNGWHEIEVCQDMWSQQGTGISANGAPVTFLRIDVIPRAGRIAEVFFAAAYLNTRAKPSVLFTWDDGRLSQYTNLLPLSKKYDIPINAYVIPNNLGITNFLSLSQAREIEAYGGVIANHAYAEIGNPNDSYSEIGITAYINQVAQCRDYLVSNGFSGGAHHAYVEGKYDESLIDQMRLIGMSTARCIAGNTSTGAQPMNEAFGVQRRLALKGGCQFSSAFSVDQAKAEVDKAVRDGRTLIFTGHDLFTASEGGAGPLAWLVSDLELLYEHVASYRSKGIVKTPNLVRWFDSLKIAS
jgi:peptidoglycan/xylan/chitin deacetylase (PgdA/CDA1 family)